MVPLRHHLTQEAHQKSVFCLVQVCKDLIADHRGDGAQARYLSRPADATSGVHQLRRYEYHKPTPHKPLHNPLKHRRVHCREHAQVAMRQVSPAP